MSDSFSMSDHQNFDFLQPTQIYLVGIKGVAMTALTECLVDLGHQVAGSDVAEDFVTATALARIPHLQIDHTFDPQALKISNPDSLYFSASVIIYSGAHQGQLNPLVQFAQDNGKLILSLGQAQTLLFNSKKLGWAVCGANGKSTVSAMLSFALDQKFPETQPSFMVGVGEIKKMSRVGRFQSAGNIMVLEADEYAEDVTQIDPTIGLTKARFSDLVAETIVANNLSFDHPDVYRDFDHTRQIFTNFFLQAKQNGYIVFNADDQNLVSVIDHIRNQRPDLHFFSFGQSEQADLHFFTPPTSNNQVQTTSCLWSPTGEQFDLQLQIPGLYNFYNALASLTTLLIHDFPLRESVEALFQFASTKRRFEFLGELNEVIFLDDYAHHPDEISAVIKATRSWYPGRRLVVAFQSHTYSRTKALFNEFVSSLATADQVVMIDIFPSAREPVTPTVTSDDLCLALNQLDPTLEAQNLHDLPALTDFCRSKLKVGDIFLSLGAGDIYHFWDYLTLSDN